MIVDSSALLALVLREPAYESVLETIAGPERILVGAPTWAATGIVLEARIGSEARSTLAMLLEHLDMQVVPFEAAHARAAREAFQRYGRGRHSASLDFGHCLTYAVAKVSGEPLLFVGDDFAQTDLEPARRKQPE